VAVIGFVGEQIGRIEPGDQWQGVGGVIGLAAGEQEPDRAAEAVDSQAPFAGQPSSGTPQSLIADPPFWPVAA
jgi:hypothetical protein